jgi:uncharacterized membrane protein YidH (DUF202 family)
MPTKTRTARYTLFGLEVVENIGLIIIGIATVVAGYHLILDIKELDVWRMLAVLGSVFLIALAVLVIRYGHVRFPYAEDTVRPGSGPQPGLRKE